MQSTKPSIPDVVERFAHYFEDDNGVWGSLHIVLDDGNVENHSVEYCIDYAEEKGDQEGAELGRILLQLSRTQRLKLPKKVDEFIRNRESVLIAANCPSI